MIQAQGIHKIYRQQNNRLHVLKGIDLIIEKGKILTIIGPSGAGKSTLLHILGGLDKPEEGKVLFDGEDIYRLRESRLASLRNRKIGFIFQFYHLLPEFNAAENIMLPAMIKEGRAHFNDMRDRAMDLLKQVGLKERADHKPNELSGGEQQRVAIARALINEPDVLLCDEPTGNLDTQNGEMIIQLLMDLNLRTRQTLVIVTHDEKISKRSHQVAHLRDGSFV